MRTWLVLAALLGSLAAEGKTTRSPAKKQDPRTVGLGRSCKKRSDCKGRGQVCIRLSDARGQERPSGFCALPCLPLDMSPAKTPPPAKTARASDAGVAAAAPDAGSAAHAQRSDGGTATASTQAHPATAAELRAAAKRKPGSRCPARYQCRSKGAGVPIDLCVKE